MAEITFLHCRRCGIEVKSDWPYCFDCNLVLAYRAMPILLGMVFTGDLSTQMTSSERYPERCEEDEDEQAVGYDDETRLIWE